ncbi:NADH:ubiquinone oxidoreductase [Ciborinia camelliae]|nr:NADH:ubiquinone oxidoreductase [Ciborinia camelliae]
MSELPSSPPSDPVDAIAYYKLQYEQLENELTEFQASSQELEAELEKDVEAAERRERLLQEKVESLGFEVEEWKTKYKQSKNEANAAQNTLQKEITSLRDANRTMQLQLRDIEVQHDDIERQARNTFSSLEDMESKFNISIERGVMMEEEIKIGEKEREQLRIETQRLRDELSDLKVEADIMQGKLRKRQFPTITTDYTAPSTPSFEPFATSPRSTASSPLINTPPDTKSVSTTDTVSETPTPPSPPMSEASATARTGLNTPMNAPHNKLKLPAGNSSATPKQALSRYASGTGRNSRGATPNGNSNRAATPAVIRQTRQKALPTRGLPNSTSLTHIRSLTAQMQRLEQRVQSARSKLPAPVATPPTTTPRTTSAMGSNYVPPSITMRSRKRTTGSTASASTTSSMTGEETSTKHIPRVSVSGISRLSFGQVGNRDGNDSSQHSSRPPSRPGSRASGSIYDRPPSRSTTGRPGAKTPIGHYSQSQMADSRRARSGMGGNYADRHGESRPHAHSQSVSYIGYGLDENHQSDHSTPTRRGSGIEGTGIPPLSGLPRRKSGGQSLSMTSLPMPRRTSTSHGFREEDERIINPRQPTGLNRAPAAPTGRPRKLSGVGECY